jgi:hypothetical protein
MMAAVDINELVSLVGKVDESRIVRTVPLPSNSQRTGMLGQKCRVGWYDALCLRICNPFTLIQLMFYYPWNFFI